MLTEKLWAPEKEQGSVETVFWERDSRWPDLEAGVSLACPGAGGWGIVGWGEGWE